MRQSEAKLGARVRVSGFLARRCFQVKNKTLKKWVCRELDSPTDGVLFGIRTLSNGELRSDDDGVIFLPTEQIKVGLVATRLHGGLLKVPLAEIVIIANPNKEAFLDE